MLNKIAVFFLKFKNFTKSLIESSQCNFDENYKIKSFFQPLVSGAADVATLKSSYQTLINENGNTAPSKQVFWDFLADTESPGISF